MRKIKFRVWNKFEENFVDSDEYAVTFNGIIFKANLDSDTYNNLISNENLKIMQYTGLKDKNDVEIYEGDIVKDGSRLWKIEISPIYGIFFILSKGGHTRCYGGFASYLVDDFQVVGNIYKNSELLRED